MRGNEQRKRMAGGSLKNIGDIKHWVKAESISIPLPLAVQSTAAFAEEIWKKGSGLRKCPPLAQPGYSTYNKTQPEVSPITQNHRMLWFSFFWHNLSYSPSCLNHSQLNKYFKAALNPCPQCAFKDVQTSAKMQNLLFTSKSQIMQMISFSLHLLHCNLLAKIRNNLFHPIWARLLTLLRISAGNHHLWKMYPNSGIFSPVIQQYLVSKNYTEHWNS